MSYSLFLLVKMASGTPVEACIHGRPPNSSEAADGWRAMVSLLGAPDRRPALGALIAIIAASVPDKVVAILPEPIRCAVEAVGRAIDSFEHPGQPEAPAEPSWVTRPNLGVLAPAKAVC